MEYVGTEPTDLVGIAPSLLGTNMLVSIPATSGLSYFTLEKPTASSLDFPNSVGSAKYFPDLLLGGS